MSQSLGFAGIVIAASLLSEILRKGGVNGSKPAMIDAWRGQNGANGTVTPSETTYQTPTETTNPWDILTGAGARDVDYVITLDPAEVQAYRDREATLRALRG